MLVSQSLLLQSNLCCSLSLATPHLIPVTSHQVTVLNDNSSTTHPLAEKSHGRRHHTTASHHTRASQLMLTSLIVIAPSNDNTSASMVVAMEAHDKSSKASASSSASRHCRKLGRRYLFGASHIIAGASPTALSPLSQGRRGARHCCKREAEAPSQAAQVYFP